MLTRPLAGQQSIVYLNRTAKRSGIKEGISLATAKALIPGLRHSEWDPAGASRMLLRLIPLVYRFSPFCAPDNEVIRFLDGLKSGSSSVDTPSQLQYGFIFDVTATIRYHKGEDALLEKIIKSFARYGIAARAAIAPSIGAAWGLARFYPLRSCAIADISAPATELPVRALRIPQSTVNALQQLGIFSIAQLLAVPRRALMTRFGSELTVRVQQFCGELEEAVQWQKPVKPLRARAVFNQPIASRSDLQSCVLKLLGNITARLGSQKKRAQLFTVNIKAKDPQGGAVILKRELSLYSAQSSCSAIQGVLAPLIEALPPMQLVDEVTLTASALTPIIEEQVACFAEERSAQIAARQDESLLNSLSGRLGEGQITQIQLLPSWLPERSFRHSPLGRKHTVEPLQLPVIDRPSRLLRRPEKVSVVAALPDSAPAQITWHGERMRIIDGEGPERIAPEWWREQPDQEREYFKVQSEDGRWLWLFRTCGSHEWYVHGMWL